MLDGDVLELTDPLLLSVAEADEVIEPNSDLDEVVVPDTVREAVLLALTVEDTVEDPLVVAE